MPGMDGIGPNGSGMPGRGFGPCRKGHNSVTAQRRMRRNVNRQWRRHNYLVTEDNQNPIYDYTADELNNRKKALEKEMKWVEDRIKEIKDNDEDSNSIN